MSIRRNSFFSVQVNMVARSVIHVALPPEWRAGTARNGAYNSIAFKNPWKTTDFTIVENTTAPRFEKGKVIVSSSGNEVSVRSCWADGCDSSNRKLDIIVTD